MVNWQKIGKLILEGPLGYLDYDEIDELLEEGEYSKALRILDKSIGKNRKDADS